MLGTLGWCWLCPRYAESDFEDGCGDGSLEGAGEEEVSRGGGEDGEAVFGVSDSDVVGGELGGAAGADEAAVDFEAAGPGFDGGVAFRGEDGMKQHAGERKDDAQGSDGEQLGHCGGPEADGGVGTLVVENDDCGDCHDGNDQHWNREPGKPLGLSFQDDQHPVRRAIQQDAVALANGGQGIPADGVGNPLGQIVGVGQGHRAETTFQMPAITT